MGDRAAVTTQDAIRTCIGCRQRAAATELLRVVVAPDATRDGAAERGDGPPVVPDPRRGMPGRGAWLHRDPGCVALAQRRRAFGRALHVPGPLDPVPVVEYVTAHYGVTEHHPAPSQVITSGNPQETKS